MSTYSMFLQNSRQIRVFHKIQVVFQVFQEVKKIQVVFQDFQVFQVSRHPVVKISKKFQSEISQTCENVCKTCAQRLMYPWYRVRIHVFPFILLWKLKNNSTFTRPSSSRLASASRAWNSAIHVLVVVVLGSCLFK